MAIRCVSLEISTSFQYTHTYFQYVSAGLKPVLSHTEKSGIVFIQLTLDRKIIYHNLLCCYFLKDIESQSKNITFSSRMNL